MREAEIKSDTGRVAGPRWYVDGYASHLFTTREDAEAARALALQHARNERNDLAARVRNAIL
jgi:hypothetical protein